MSGSASFLWRVRRARADDSDALARLEAAAFDARSWGEASLRESFSAPGVTVLLGERKGAAPEGFAIWRDLGGEAELLSIGVVPSVRRRGLGAALLAAVIAGARAAGGKKVFLEVDAGNAPAIALYARFDFVTDGVRRGYYRDGADAALMSRPV